MSPSPAPPSHYGHFNLNEIDLSQTSHSVGQLPPPDTNADDKYVVTVLGRLFLCPFLLFIKSININVLLLTSH